MAKRVASGYSRARTGRCNCDSLCYLNAPRYASARAWPQKSVVALSHPRHCTVRKQHRMLGDTPKSIARATGMYPLLLGNHDVAQGSLAFCIGPARTTGDLAEAAIVSTRILSGLPGWRLVIGIKRGKLTGGHAGMPQKRTRTPSRRRRVFGERIVQRGISRCI